MRVLFVCHRVPFPPKRGGKIRPFNIIRHLHEQGHEVTVASMARSQAELDEAEGLAQYCTRRVIQLMDDRVARSRTVAWLPTTRPSSFGYFYSRRLARLILEVPGSNQETGVTGKRTERSVRGQDARWDMVFVHCSSVAPYVLEVPARTKFIDYGDMDSQKWREYAQYKPFPLSAGYWLEAMKLERTERQLARHFQVATCTTRAELDALRALGVNTPSDWFPNGVDAEFFRPSQQPYDPNLVTFIGRMDYFPNQQAATTFCTDVLPELQRRRPGTRFEIVGADPSPEIRALGRRPGVTVTGSVPDVRPYVTRAALTVAPLEIARGTQNKILESMAMAVPVVCSRQAAGGVDAVPGEHLLACESREQFLEAVLRLQGSAEQRERFAAAGRARVLSNHSWPASMRRLDTIIAALFERQAAA